MINEELELNKSSARKSLDDTNSKIDDKYGEKFWQNQTKRIIELNRMVKFYFINFHYMRDMGKKYNPL